jgi:hypothetical protein
MLARLRRGCPEFAIWWEVHDIRGVAAGQKRLSHPRRGSLRFEYATFQANDDPALKLAIYAPMRGDLTKRRSELPNQHTAGIAGSGMPFNRICDGNSKKLAR